MNFLPIRKTVVTPVEYQDQICSIFKKMGFDEDSRNSFSTDHNGNVQITITFIGKESYYNDRLFILMPTFPDKEDQKETGVYISPIFPSGFYCKSLDQYKKAYNQKKIGYSIQSI